MSDPMGKYSREDLEEGLKAVDSLVAKSQKALETLRPGTAQHTTLTRRLKAFGMARDAIDNRLQGENASEK
ncbi:MAG: hypothetical protein KBA51_09610 [Kiritimatiellae bacterium]|nr:hypothetical protein [Kiritimatiellia bacterium]